MSNTANINDLVETLLRPAIDSFMAAEKGYLSTGFLAPVSDGYSEEVNGVYGYILEDLDEFGGGVLRVISCPDASGQGGGVNELTTGLRGSPTLQDKTDRYMEEFDRIRSRIRTLFSDFSELPKPDSFNPAIDAAAAAVNVLAIDFHDFDIWRQHSLVDSGETYQGTANQAPSGLPAVLDTIFSGLSNTSSFSGSAIEPFRRRYVTGLQTATQGIFGLLLLYGAHLQAEKLLWEEADHSIRLLIEETRTAFIESVDSSSDINWSDFFKVAGIVTNALSAFLKMTVVGAPHSAAASLVAIGFDTAAHYSEVEECSVSDSDGTVTHTSNYSDVAAFVSDAVMELRASIRSEEGLIARYAEQNLSTVHDSPDIYDLSGPIFNLNDPGASRSIRWQTQAADSVSSAMLLAAEPYQSSASKLAATSIYDAATRPPGLGHSRIGPADELNDLGSTLKALLVALGDELENGHRLMGDVTVMFQNVEEGAVGDLDILFDEVDLASVAELPGDRAIQDPLAEDTPDIPRLDVRSIMTGTTPDNSYFRDQAAKSGQ